MFSPRPRSGGEGLGVRGKGTPKTDATYPLFPKRGRGEKTRRRNCNWMA
jgi:hypothetical protein